MDEHEATRLRDVAAKAGIEAPRHGGELTLAEVQSFATQIGGADMKAAVGIIHASIETVVNMVAPGPPIRRAAVLRALAARLLTEAETLAPAPRPPVT